MQGYDHYLERLKSSVSLLSLAEEYGLTLKKQGRSHLGYCPFHEETTPSFHIFPQDERFHCFGCGSGGDVIDFVQRKGGLDHVEAVRKLAAKAGLPLPEREERDEQQVQEQRDAQATLAEFCQVSHRALLADTEALAVVQSWGLTLETIQAQEIGLASYQGQPPTDARKQIGLYTEGGSTAVSGRIIFPVRMSGRVVNLSARAYREPDAKPKYKNLSGQPIVPFNRSLLKGEGTVLLCEGVKDALLLGQAGFDAVATFGTSVKAEWLPWFGTSKTLALCYDNDANGAGQKGAERIARTLFDAGLRVTLVSLPAGQDPADVLVKEGGAGVIKQLVAQARPWVDYVIDQLPPAGGEVLAAQLNGEVFPLLRRLPQIAADQYLDRLCRVKSIRKPVLRQAWEAFLKEHAGSTSKAGGQQEEEGAEVVPTWRADNPVMFNPAQSFVKGLGVFTVYAEAAGQNALHPFLVTSDRKIRSLSPDVARELGLIFRQNKYPSEALRWPIGTKYTNCVQAWLEAKEQVDPAQLYRDVRDLIKGHIHWPEDLSAIYDLLTLWVIGTYTHQLFDSFPYIHVRAIAGSGKTSLLRIVEAVAFNGAMSAAITESVVSRLVNSDCSTLCVDEAERFRKGQQDEGSNILEVMNSGYKKGAFSRKAGNKKVDFRPESFDTYSPKMLASIDTIDATLSTRCIDIPLMKCGQAMPPFLPEESDTHLQELRGTLYCWALSQWENVKDAYLGTHPGADWINRAWELWKPVVALATYFDASVQEGLEEKMLTLAGQIKESKAAREQEQNWQHRMVGVILDYVREHRPLHPDEFYPISLLCDRIKDEAGAKDLTVERLSRFLFDEAHFCTDRTADRAKRRGLNFIKPVSHIRLRQDVVWPQAVALFGFPKEILDETEPADTGSEIRAEDPFEE